ncbi:VQ motif-containing protein 4-like [Phalaenopsis equestris]|uniref:VQ motif-containing protein 4-like n=1 Tax=Phalaenopsis equestris TaxID=78828 RepID=UPI0009E5D7F8|nr:VQ motif-containing protein 4-like [Phalaenopsis equestris]
MGLSSSSNGASLPPKAAPLSVAPATPKSTPRLPIDSNPYPTTFIQADTSSFKQVVQMLTGAKQTAAAPKTSISPAGKTTGPKKPAFKLYERRGSMKNLKMISPMIPSFAGRSNPNSPAAAAFSPRKMTEILSPSMLDLPSLALSPVTPLNSDPFDRDVLKAEERAIAEKGFYFLPSPRTTHEPPRLLPLFPVSSSEVLSSSFT